MNKFFPVLLTLMISAGCSSTSGEHVTHAENSGQTAHSEDAKPLKSLSGDEIKKCKEAGGVVKNVGLMQLPTCVITYPDAGKPCKNSSECTKTCVVMHSSVPMGTAVTGECQRDNALYGCFSIVEDGVTGPSLCVD